MFVSTLGMQPNGTSKVTEPWFRQSTPQPCFLQTALEPWGARRGVLFFPPLTHESQQRVTSESAWTGSNSISASVPNALPGRHNQTIAFPAINFAWVWVWRPLSIGVVWLGIHITCLFLLSTKHSANGARAECAKPWFQTEPR